MKKRGPMARLSHFVILGLIAIPSLVLAIGHSPVVRVPEAIPTPNSQTMPLLEGYRNTDPTNIGGPLVAIVDGSTLSAASEDASAFIEKGSSGTGKISTYTVRPGDTLGSIAAMFGVSVNTIRWANSLSGSTLKVGQELVILPISGVKHTVKAGDTVSSIARKYDANQADIISYNNLSPDASLAVGDEILIPDGELTSGASSASVAQEAASGLKESVGYYLRPIVGGHKSQGIHGHNAVDLAAPIGTPIMAAADGVVILSKTGGYNGGYGTYVVLSHDNGTQTVYAHMSENDVTVGEKVPQGEMLGRIGMTGNTSGPHVHFEVRGAKNPF